MDDFISRKAAIDAIDRERKNKHLFNTAEDGLLEARRLINTLPPAQPETTKEYNLKNIYNIYVKIAQAHFVYQPSKPKTITAMPFDWIETQNLLEKYLKDHGADFDALCREYISENVKDDYLPFAQQSRLENAIHGKSPEEIYEFLSWLFLRYAMQFTDSRLAIIDWLKGEKE